MYRIYIVEDDDKIAAILREHIEKYGYEVTRTNDFQNIKSEVIRQEPHLVLLDSLAH